MYIRKRNDKDWEVYKKQINFCVDLLRKTRTRCFKNLNFKELPNYGKFWKTIKPYCGNKDLNSNKRLLKGKKSNLVSDEKELAIIMTNFFINITKDEELEKDGKGKFN